MFVYRHVPESLFLDKSSLSPLAQTAFLLPLPFPPAAHTREHASAVNKTRAKNGDRDEKTTFPLKQFVINFLVAVPPESILQNPLISLALAALRSFARSLALVSRQPLADAVLRGSFAAAAAFEAGAWGRIITITSNNAMQLVFHLTHDVTHSPPFNQAVIHTLSVLHNFPSSLTHKCNRVIHKDK